MHFDTTDQYRNLFIGLEAETPLLDGTRRTYINLDNAASTPPMRAVLEAVNNFLIYYSSVHRGTGFKSQLSTHAYEEARQTLMEFLGANSETHTCIFGKNSTEAINKLARRFPFSPERNVVLTSGMEHHSNDLPWRAATQTIHVSLTSDGYLDEADFDEKLERYASQVALVTITGASNVTGILNQIHDLAKKVHAAGAQIAIDCAQLAPHRQIEMRSLDDPTHLDYVVISAHKMYAPFGSGALVGRRDTFQRGEPDMTGGGTIEIVTLDDVIWAEPPDRDEAGSPNTVGAIALAAAIKQLQAVGMDKVAEHEAKLTAYALEGLNSIPNIHIYGDNNPAYALSRLGVIPFQIEGMSHFLVASILGYEFGIGVRSGCFCAHPYILHLLGISPQHARAVRQNMLAGDRSDMPGLIRISFGLYNTREEVDAFLEALSDIIQGKYQGKYSQDIASGEFTPQRRAPDFEEFFSLPH
jgi:cysteine desulfurase/selenocysteine lyase